MSGAAPVSGVAAACAGNGGGQPVAGLATAAEPAAGTGPAAGHACSAVVTVPLPQALRGWLVDGYDTGPCGEPAVAWCSGACACGHAREGALCAGHAGHAGRLACRACAGDQASPHECPVAVARAEVPGGR